MDALGVPLEAPMLAEVSGTIGDGWSAGKAGRHLDSTRRAEAPRKDSLRTKLRLVPLMPATLKLDMRWQRGVPGAWPATGQFLRDLSGHDFPVLANLRNKRIVRAVASMLHENLDAGSSVVGLRVKVLIGAVFAAIVNDEALMADVHATAPKFEVSKQELSQAVVFTLNPEAPAPEGDGQARLELLLARAASPSPARIDAGVVEGSRQLPPAGIVEVVCWLAVLPMLHRLTCYYSAPGARGCVSRRT